MANRVLTDYTALRKAREACILLKLRDPGVGPGTGQPSAS